MSYAVRSEPTAPLAETLPAIFRYVTAADGKSPKIYLSLFNVESSEARRDASFDADAIVHEYTHGSNINCLQDPKEVEARGLDEGWADFMAVAAKVKPTDNRNTQYGFGQWTAGRDEGSRFVLYTTDQTVNWAIYPNETDLLAIHEGNEDDSANLPYWIGTLWATALLEVLWNLIEKHGITDAAVPRFDSRGVPTDGRYLTMKLVVHAMMLQPCFPNVVDARDAMLDADFALTGGENKCEIWRGFAVRGFGSNAYSSPRYTRNSFEVPDGC